MRQVKSVSGKDPLGITGCDCSQPRSVNASNPLGGLPLLKAGRQLQFGQSDAATRSTKIHGIEASLFKPTQKLAGSARGDSQSHCGLARCDDRATHGKQSTKCV